MSGITFPSASFSVPASTPTPAQQVSKVTAITAAAWDIRADSAHAIRRRAPHGYVPLRRRRAALHLVQSAVVIAHSW